MKTILLLHDEARRPTQLVAKRSACECPDRRNRRLSPPAIATAGDIRVQAVSSALLNRHRSFRFQCPRRNEVKHGIPNCI